MTAQQLRRLQTAVEAPLTCALQLLRRSDRRSSRSGVQALRQGVCRQFKCRHTPQRHMQVYAIQQRA